MGCINPREKKVIPTLIYHLYTLLTKTSIQTQKLVPYHCSTKSFTS